MALFNTALVALSMSDVFLSDGMEGSQDCRRIHMLLTEYAKDKHALIVCQLADGSKLCDDPPNVLYSITFPNEQLDFKFEQKDLTVTIFARSQWYFCLVFESGADFWEVVRVAAEAHGIHATREENVKELLKKAVSSIPTVRDFPDGLPA